VISGIRRQQPGRKYRFGGRKRHIVGQEDHFVVRQNCFVVLPDETSGHLFRPGIQDDYSVAQDKRIVVYREHFRIQKFADHAQGHAQEGQQFRFVRGKNEYPGQGDKQEGQLHGLGGQLHRNPIRKNGILAPHLVQVVRRQHAGVRENSDGVFLRAFVHVHVNTCT